MARIVVRTDFLSEIFHEVHALPLKGFAGAAAVGLLSTTIDLSFRQLGGQFSAFEYAVTGIFAALWLAVAYWIVTMKLQTAASAMGGLRFSAVAVLSVGLPLGAFIASLWLMRLDGGAAALTGFLLSAFLLMFCVPLLAAWPVSQALSSGFVSPLAVLKETKGHRWGLIVASYLSAAFNQLVPSTDTARSGEQAILLAAGNGAVSCAGLLLFVSIAVTAWKFAVPMDHALASSSKSDGTA